MCSAAAQDAQPAGQAQAPTSGTSSSSNAANTREFTRRFTIGGSFSVLGFSLVPGKTSTIDTSSTVTSTDKTTGASSRYGFGLTGEARLSNHFAVDVYALYRRIGYTVDSTISTSTTQILNGVSTSTTTNTSTHRDTRARLFDFPFMARYYSGTRNPPNGPRWFLEAGGVWRWANGIRSSVSSTDASGNVACCSNISTPGAHTSSIGVVAGAGVLLIDPLGIHVVPEVRYTRWIDQVFNNGSTRTDQNQLEGSISLTF